MKNDFFSDEAEASKIKRAVIAGASEALKLKNKEWKRSDEAILQDITHRIEEIIKKID